LGISQPGADVDLRNELAQLQPVSLKFVVLLEQQGQPQVSPFV
jgi:hypothetical protein